MGYPGWNPEVGRSVVVVERAKTQGSRPQDPFHFRVLTRSLKQLRQQKLHPADVEVDFWQDRHNDRDRRHSERRTDAEALPDIDLR